MNAVFAIVSAKFDTLIWGYQMFQVQLKWQKTLNVQTARSWGIACQTKGMLRESTCFPGIVVRGDGGTVGGSLNVSKEINCTILF